MSAADAWAIFLGALIVAAALGFIASAYFEHRAYLRMFDRRRKRPPFSLRCALGWHKDDNLVAVHNGFDLLRCSRCDRPTMRRMPK